MSFEYSTKRTAGQRAADAVRNGMGSWTFVGVFLCVMAVWMFVNTVMLARHGFDKYPYILLNLMLSTLAGLQGAILLIAAKRQDQISSQLAEQTYTNTEAVKSMLESDATVLDGIKAVEDSITQEIQQNTVITKEIHSLTVVINGLTETMHDHIMSDKLDKMTKKSPPSRGGRRKEE